ncbi:sugar transferase [Acinetobacter soli]
MADKELYAEYTELEIQYLLSAKPGISGYWQVNGRSNVKYPERKRMELHYVQNKSE